MHAHENTPSFARRVELSVALVSGKCKARRQMQANTRVSVQVKRRECRAQLNGESANVNELRSESVVATREQKKETESSKVNGGALQWTWKLNLENKGPKLREGELF